MNKVLRFGTAAAAGVALPAAIGSGSVGGTTGGPILPNPGVGRDGGAVGAGVAGGAGVDAPGNGGWAGTGG